jgi:hypothetical protein
LIGADLVEEEVVEAKLTLQNSFVRISSAHGSEQPISKALISVTLTSLTRAPLALI